jgi:hypothetical protein
MLLYCILQSTTAALTCCCVDQTSLLEDASKHRKCRYRHRCPNEDEETDKAHIGEFWIASLQNNEIRYDAGCFK